MTPGPRSTEQGDQGSPSPKRFAVRVSLPAHKAQALLEELRSIIARARRELFTETVLGPWRAWGLGSRVSLPRLSYVFIRQIWAAFAARSKSGAHPKLGYRKQIAAALHWLGLIALGNQGGLSKTVYFEDRFQDGIVLV